MEKMLPIQSTQADHEIWAEVQELLGSRKRFPRLAGTELPKANLRSFVESCSLESPTQKFSPDRLEEAIVLAFGRPVLLVQDNSFEEPDSQVWKDRLEPHRSRLEALLPSVGRVELHRHPDFEWVGTGWVIAANVLVTNRHVAETFVERAGRELRFRRNLFGRPISARVDFREEFQRGQEFEANVEEVLFLAEPGIQNPDIAFLRLATGHDLPTPLTLAARDPEPDQLISVVGYPARDSRNGTTEMERIFGDVFNVKRLAPGFVTSTGHPMFQQHDCSTLGGNSGSPLISPETGDAVGLHFAGRFLESNFALKPSAIRNVLSRLEPPVFPGVDPAEDEDDPAPGLDDREGYSEAFLGEDREHYVPLPRLSDALQADVSRRPGRRGECGYVLDYTHFSVVQNKARKLPMFTAVNIDGERLVSVRRRGTRWRLDPRIPAGHQSGNELYRSNDLDRGHLVRRLDPVWGASQEAEQANHDTFHYTNAAPQHARLNQRTWLELEDHLLDNAGAHDLKISVFTGPVFGEHDRLYRGVQLPEEFWKVVAMVREDGSLHATAYLLTQADLLTDFEFAFGQFKTFQVPLARVEELTDLSFGRLPDHDPLAAIEGVGALRLLRRPQDVLI